MDPIEEFNAELEVMDVGLAKNASWDSAAKVAVTYSRLLGHRNVTVELLQSIYPRWADIVYGITDAE
jgi:hypothetical protein